MTMPGMIGTARTLTFYTRLEEVTANNLANVGTDGFKAERMTAHGGPGSWAPVPVSQTDLRQGTFRETGRSLDLALEGDGYFVVYTDGGERLTRGGSFRLDGSGRLTDMHGDPVIGQDGPIVLTRGTVEVRADGTIVLEGAAADTLRLVRVSDPGTLRKEGAGRFIAAGATVPALPGDLRVRQGAVEEANMDPIRGLVDLITIQRAYAANIDALKAMDSVLGTVVNELARP